MNMTPVESSNIASVGYDEQTKVLHIQFKSGATHAYSDVSPEKHKALMAAESKGKHFIAHIRNSHKSNRVESTES